MARARVASAAQLAPGLPAGCQNPETPTCLGPVSISGDGRYVAYASEATNLLVVGAKGEVPDTNQAADVFVADLPGGRTARVSVTSTGAQVVDGFTPLQSLTPQAISAEGRYVGFPSTSVALADADCAARASRDAPSTCSSVTARSTTRAPRRSRLRPSALPAWSSSRRSCARDGSPWSSAAAFPA